ncbi:membrane protein, partial [Candidatus Magnetomorum sp. HK-1]
ENFVYQEIYYALELKDKYLPEGEKFEIIPVCFDKVEDNGGWCDYRIADLHRCSFDKDFDEGMKCLFNVLKPINMLHLICFILFIVAISIISFVFWGKDLINIKDIVFTQNSKIVNSLFVLILIICLFFYSVINKSEFNIKTSFLSSLGFGIFCCLVSIGFIIYGTFQCCQSFLVWLLILFLPISSFFLQLFRKMENEVNNLKRSLFIFCSIFFGLLSLVLLYVYIFFLIKD